MLKITSGAAKAVGTEAFADGADELHKTKGVSEGGDVGASTANTPALVYKFALCSRKTDI